MRRVLFSIRGLRVWSYPAFFFLGVNVGMFVENWAAKASGLDSQKIYLATLLLLPPAIAASRGLFIVANRHNFPGGPRRLWQRGEGGMSMLGSVPCMLLVSVPLLAWLGVSFWRFWDVAIFCILTGMCFTRVGCLLNGCCAGRASDSPLAIRLPDARGVWRRRMPTQVLEGALALLLLCGALICWQHPPTPGLLFLSVTAAYSLGRIGLQALREERQRVGPVDVHQAISTAFLLLSVAALAGMAR